MAGLRIRLQMTKLLFLHRDKAWFDAVKRVHAFLDKHIDKVFEDLQAEKASGEKAKHSNGRERTDLLYIQRDDVDLDQQCLLRSRPAPSCLRETPQRNLVLRR
jgi:hypothetical protein